MRADITDTEKPNLDAYLLMEELGNDQHAPPFLAVFPGDRPNDPQKLDGEYSKEDLLKIIRQLPDPPKS